MPEMFGKCSDTLLMRHFFSAKRAVTVDECPTCAGVWLDAGELEMVLHMPRAELLRVVGEVESGSRSK